MTGKISGLGAACYIGGYDLSGDIGALDSIQGGPVALDVTSIKKSGVERIGGLRSASFQISTWFNVDTTGTVGEHKVLSALPTADVDCWAMPYTPAVGSAAFAMRGKQLNYDGTRGADGSLSFKVQADSDGYGGEWGKLLTAGIRTDTTATTGAFYDDGAASNFGGQAYLQVFALTGTSVTVDIQHATTSGGTYSSTGLTFTAVSAAPAVQRVAVANTTTINEFLKVVTTGTFTSAKFAVLFVRNPIAGQVF